ncbi:MAG: DUF2075 domain-containing protein [Lentisphaerae bacterium]|jgi:hypothetical protein|nr:DUF2075 domain-containing protein [Lentisphaerota bacterium]
MLPHQLNRRHRAWFGTEVVLFQKLSVEEIIGTLAGNSGRDGFDVSPSQVAAWEQEIKILQHVLPSGLVGEIFLEFNIPRMGRRVDAVLTFSVADLLYIIVFEFKVGERCKLQDDIDQVWDYALDLKNFHKGSHDAKIVPVLLATKAKESTFDPEYSCDNVAKPLFTSINGAKELLQRLTQETDSYIVREWENTSYSPTPTIIEAARSLYANHSVEAITRSDAGAINLTDTSQCVLNLISDAAENSKKVICFVTGVPGAGKTLVGLNVATKNYDTDSGTHATYLSGNGPLIAVLTEALVRDEVERLKKKGKPCRKGDVAAKVKSFLQNVHHFRDEALRSSAAPEHVVIFDEAQRAWNLQMTRNFMQRKKRVSDFNKSEPEFLIEYMDRRPDWAVIICLVGGGQEINTGEAGISAWLEAIMNKFPHWEIAMSDRLTDSEYAAGQAVQIVRTRKKEGSKFLPNLHLHVSMRSFRSERLSEFVKALLELDRSRSQELLQELEKYPICITRDLKDAKNWIRTNARGSERYGLLASSKALRLKPFAIDVNVEANPVYYFLNGKNDPRSSFFMEAVATEFQVQGLELDWACIAWDGDLRINHKCHWNYHDFRGQKWINIRSEANQKYLLNAYRVLLTRARQGMVIFVPHGNNPPDATRDSSFLDGTYNYLRSVGIPQLEPQPEINDLGY